MKGKKGLTQKCRSHNRGTAARTAAPTCRQRPGATRRLQPDMPPPVVPPVLPPVRCVGLSVPGAGREEARSGTGGLRRTGQRMVHCKQHGRCAESIQPKAARRAQLCCPPPDVR